jgi:orotidine-5'-phosphate decarboxylase
MNREKLISEIKKKQTLLCVGLDTDIKKIPKHLLKFEDPIFEFNKAIIDATNDICIAYKPNTAFYESMGAKGWESLEKTSNYISEDIFKIADAKRGDIGNTSEMYARAFYENLNFDAVTVAPYMGEDSVKPFFYNDNKWAIVLALTSNTGALDFQFLSTNTSNKKLFEEVLIRTSKWASKEQLMFVVGATRAEMLEDIRKIVPEHFLLIPGVGAQGGNLEDVIKYGLNKDFGLIINASRSIIYASQGEDFAEKAREEALKMSNEMKVLLEKYSSF